MRARILQGAALAVLMTVTACGPRDEQDQGDDMDSTRSVTQAVGDYEAFNDALIKRLDTELGSRPWETDADSGGRAYCGEDGSGIEVVLPNRRFDGSYPAESRAAVRDLVIEVGKANGFGDPELLVERDDYLKVVAVDEAGGKYTFVTSVNTVLSTWTGCHPVD